ncbi:sigma-E processing peptidase SpoIIGA [Ruminococcus sp. CLA-AA-H200]|uniref:Sigma-E processing peptidase SpoIIGA n=1 Tax=Ruminococcus turbiniformis TaxID=2881258 RepID=A0ABS8FV84_9FIRM|nr:sigma-E processing peptidase SpoIIGA [Ruminococcus turbiniformis]MCC2253976.1 sigma-E processing peptidase SpoIIGA [Ruminococcus turbiniformis]
MYYELYIDLFFLENFMIDSLLLTAVNRVLKRGQPYWRLMLGGASGSVLTCFVIALPLPAAARMLLFHLVVNSLMLLIGLGYEGAAGFVRAFLLLYVSAVFMGGIMQILRPYMRYASIFYAAAAVGFFLFLGSWKVMSRLCVQKSSLRTVTLCTGCGETEVSALLDTGNSLRDFVSGDPVSILDPELVKEITENPEKERGFHVIPYRCVGGESVMKVFRIEKMCIHMEEERWIMNPLVGVGEETLSGDGAYEMILNPELLSE